MNDVIYKTEDDLLELLDKITSDAIKPEEYNFKFADISADLQKLVIVFEGEELEGVITSSMMEAVLAMQKQIFQLYADVIYNGNIRKLTAKERKMLEVHLKVENGSTIIEILFSIILAELLNRWKIVGNFETNELIIVAIILLILNSSGKVYKWIANKKAKEQVSATQIEIELEKEKLSFANAESKRRHELELARLNNDLEKLKVITQTTEKAAHQVEKTKEMMARKNIPTDTMEERTEAVFKPLMVATEHAGKVDIEGLVIHENEARTIRQPIREDKIKTQLNGKYRVQIVNTKEQGIFKVQLLNIETGQEFWATVQEQDKSGIKKVISDAEWSKKPLHLAINADMRKNSVVDAVIVSAEWLE